MKKRFLLSLITALILAITLSIGAFAADVVYLKDGGNGDGSSPEKAFGDMADAFVALPYGGTIVVCGDYTFANSVNYDAALPGFTSPAADGTVTITGEYGGTNYSGRLICAGGERYVCTADTTFDNITLYNGSNKTFVISGRFFNLTFGKGCKMEKIEVHAIGGLDHTNGVISVPDDDYSKDSHVTVLGGTIAELTGLGRNVGKNQTANYTGTAYITIGENAVVNKLFGAYRWGSKTVTGGACDITLDGGSITNFMTGCGSEEVAYNVDVTVRMTGNVNPDKYFITSDRGWRYDNAFIGLNAGALYRSGTNFGHTILDVENAPQITSKWIEEFVCTENFDVITGLKNDAANMDVVYLSDSGSDENSGTTYSKPVQSIGRAFKLLGKDGGFIVVCGKVKIDTSTKAAFPAYGGEVVITSLYDGIDYRETGASLHFGVDVFLGGDTVLEYIDISNENGAEFYCQGNSLHIGKEVSTSYTQNPMAIWGGTDCARSGITVHNTKFFDYTIEIDSGDWYYVRGGSVRTGEAQAVGTIGNVSIIINGGRITNTTTSPTMNGIIAVGGFDALEGDANIIIRGGEINCAVMGIGRPGYNSTASNSAYARGNINITVTGGKFRSGISIGAIHDVVASELDGDFTLAVSGGDFAKGFKGFNAESVLGNAALITVGNLGFDEVDFDKSVHVSGIADFEKELEAAHKDKKDVVYPTVSVKSDVVYVRDGGEGDGSTPENALGDIVAATEKLKNGGTIVVCGKLTVETGKTLRKTDGKLTLTSTYGGVDYAALSNARIELVKYISFNSETLIENIKFVSKGNDCYISAEGNEFTVGDGVECEIFKGNRTEDYPDLIAGSFALSNSLKKDVHLTVKSGTWGSLVGGQFSIVQNSGKTRRIEGNITLDVYGGTFTDDCYIAGINNLNGNATLNAHGGTFACSVFAISGEAVTVNGNVTLYGYKSGFEGDIRVSKNSAPVFNGTYALNINGANITRASAIVGADGISGNNTSKITVSDINLEAPLSGNITFTNPIAAYADPSIVFHDGYYYYTYANGYDGGMGLWMAKAANLCDIGKVEPVLIWSQKQSGVAKEMTALWAPQLYFMDGRWYIYAAAQTSKDTATGEDRRFPYVWVGQVDDPMGAYEYFGCMENIDTDVFTYLSPRVIKHGGKWYMFISGFYTQSDTNPHTQRMRVCELASPTKMASKQIVISSPVYDYEAGIMEGPYPFYAPNGTLYLIFAAGHTRTDLYCTGIMRFNGSESDSLLDAGKWEKFAEPLQYTNYDNFVYSPGAMVVTTSPSGAKFYGVYHAKEYHYSAYSMRRMHMQEITFDANGFPTMDDPQPTDTVFTVEMNSLPLAKRISGFDAVESAASGGFEKSRQYENSFTDVPRSTWYYTFVKVAYEYALANGTSSTAFSPNGKFTVAQALTAAVNVHKAYYGTTVRNAASGEKWYTPYVEYCVNTGIIKADQFDNVERNITRGEMATVFANILPEGEYAAVKNGSCPDVTSDMACAAAVKKLFDAGIVGGDAGTGNFRPNDEIVRSEACVIFTRIAAKEHRQK